MSFQKTLVFIISGGLLLLSGCAGKATRDHLSLPETTVASFNFLVNPVTKKSELILFNQSGNRLSKFDSTLPENAKLVSEYTINFYQVNPCYVELKAPGVPPRYIKISDGPCP